MANHPEVLAFLEDIKKHPDDDTPRLVLADWLQDFGQTEEERGRGEFIRLQCWLIPRALDDPQRRLLKQRERELQQQYEDRWLQAWHRVSDWWFCRGLVGLIVHQLQDLHHIEETEWAWVDGLQLTDDTDLQTLATSPWLKHLQSLHLESLRLEDEPIRWLISSPCLGHLTHLLLSGNRIGDQGALHLASSTRLTALSALDLSSNHIGDEGARALLHSSGLDNLVLLDLQQNLISQSVKPLLRERFGKGLRL